MKQCCVCRYDTLDPEQVKMAGGVCLHPACFVFVYACDRNILQAGCRHTLTWLRPGWQDLVGIFGQMPSAKVVSTAALVQHMIYRLWHLSIALDPEQ